MIALLLFILLIIFILWMIWAYCGLREIIGDCLIKLFPLEPLKEGDKVEIFLDGKYNRKATITGIDVDKIVIYDRVKLPVDYRGRFYAIGVDITDGSKLVYLSRRSHHKFVKASELVRKLFNVIDDEQMLPVSEEEASEEDDE